MASESGVVRRPWHGVADGGAKLLSVSEDICTKSLAWLLVPPKQMSTALRRFWVGCPSD